MNKQKHLPRINTELHGNKNKQKNRHGDTHPLGAKSKGSNGVVAVGLPHRNYSVLKQTHIN
jgi:hypothetical protein